MDGLHPGLVRAGIGKRTVGKICPAGPFDIAGIGVEQIARMPDRVQRFQAAKTAPANMPLG
ncbi:glutamate synthase [NADPH] large chain [Burkholderiales bacterium GJ-E10]|nr:glutamate synthase [NADPH] large chain [Burkholderiales bacterium GJ-E10]